MEELTISQMSRLMDDGSITSFDLVSTYLERIARYDSSGPELNSMLEINPDAIHIAEAMDYERSHQGKRSLLHGVPVVLKDNINTGDKMHTSAGSLWLATNYASRDAFMAGKLRDAGAVILGKSNMTEFANYMANNMPGGFSSRGGQVRNPYNKDWSPWGSSSGSAVAVSANLCAVAIGTETNDSILGPARANNIVGLKPTVGLVSRDGIIPISNSQDTAGPLARTVEDAAIVLGAITGVDSKDPATWKSRWKLQHDYTRFLEDNLEGLAVGIVLQKQDDLEEHEKEILNEASELLKSKGVRIVKPVEMCVKPPKRSFVLRHEFKVGINYYLSDSADFYAKSLADIIALNNTRPGRCLKHGQALLEGSDATSGTLTEPEYILSRLEDIKWARREGIDKVMKDMELDALLFIKYSSIAAVAGYPSIIVPAGYDGDGKPCGLILVGKPFSEPVLLKLAYAYEQATKKRVPPI